MLLFRVSKKIANQILRKCLVINNLSIFSKRLGFAVGFFPNPNFIVQSFKDVRSTAQGKYFVKKSLATAKSLTEFVL